MRRSLLALSFALLLSTTTHADDLFVAGPDGQVLRADAETGAFEYFACLCAGPITALGVDDEQLFVADALGQVLAFDAATGDLEYTFALPAAANALIVHGDDLVVALEDWTIRRVDRRTGALKHTRPSPTQVHAMVLDRGFFYVAGLDGAVYRAGSLEGAFQYFTCFCFAKIEALVMDRDHLIAGDELGLVGRIDLWSGDIDSAYFFPGGLNAMVRQGSDVLVHRGARVIERANAATGPAGGTPVQYTSPVDVTVMLLRERDLPVAVTPLGPPLGGLRRR